MIIENALDQYNENFKDEIISESYEESKDTLEIINDINNFMGGEQEDFTTKKAEVLKSLKTK